MYGGLLSCAAVVITGTALLLKARGLNIVMESIRSAASSSKRPTSCNVLPWQNLTLLLTVAYIIT